MCVLLYLYLAIFLSVLIHTILTFLFIYSAGRQHARDAALVGKNKANLRAILEKMGWADRAAAADNQEHEADEDEEMHE